MIRSPLNKGATINLQTTSATHTRSSCILCDGVDNNQMVQCDSCDKWFHFECVKVTQAVENEEWKCTKCIELSHGPIENYPLNAAPTTTAISRANSDRSVTSHRSQKRKQLDLSRLEEERKMLEDRRRQQVEEDRAYLDKKYALLNSSDSEEDLQEDNTIATNRWVEQHNVNTILNEAHAQSSSAQLLHNSQPTTNIGANILQSTNGPNLNAALTNIRIGNRDARSLPSPTHQERNAYFGNQLPASTYWPGMVTNNVLNQPEFNNRSQGAANRNVETGPTLTTNQIAARHVISKELPSFNGNPEEWPLFISSYEATTRTCGFSNEENMIRLQRSLKGRALDAVRCRLLIPAAVPEAIGTLRMLFGRPEQIIHTLLQKIKNESAPKMDKLETLINFAVSVQNLCATIEAAGLPAHLSNPTLLQELVEKLPAQIKLNWAMFQQNSPVVTLATLGNWLFQIAQAAAAVTLPTIAPQTPDRSERRCGKDKGYLHAHAEANAARNVSQNKPTSTLKCLICDKPHQKIQDCNLFKELSRNERWAAVKQHKLCRTCLGTHSQFRCKTVKKCGKDGCEILHHPLLHKDEHPSSQNVDANSSAQCNTHQQPKQAILFRIIPVVLYSKTSTVKTFAFLDEGSSMTLIEEDLANDLELNGTPESLCLKWTADTVRVEKDSRRVTLEISGQHNVSHKYKISDVRTVKSLNLPLQSIATSEYAHLQGLPIQQYRNATPRILIGLDNWNLGLPLEIREGRYRQPVATRSRLGWTVHGLYHHQVAENSTHNYHSFHMCNCKNDTELHNLVKEFFSLENFGVKKPEIVLESDTDRRARKILQTTTIEIGNRYETGLLWKYDHAQFPDSLPMAKKRLCCLERKMQQNPILADNLKSLIRDYVSKGYARKLSPEELQQHHQRKWYLPIFTVTKVNKPGKLRLVWDAAAKVNDVSLNSTLMKGPDLLTSLPGVIYRFRERKIAICGDIKEMFHQVRIRKADQHSQRFLWRNGDTNANTDVYVMQVMTFGATCSPSSAQYVKNINALQFQSKFPRATKAIIENHYVDDMLESVESDEEAIKLALDVKNIHQKAGFEIRNWISNSSNVRSALGVASTGEKKNLNLSLEPTVEKVLGMFWCTTSDTFTYSLVYNQMDKQILSGIRRPTKREVLRMLMSIFDPLGLLAFFLVYVKILLQEIWRSAIDWDEEIIETQYTKWLVWLQLLPHVEKIRIPRCYNIHANTEPVDLHVFVDASENAYAAVAYFRITTKEGVHCSLVGAKTKVAPLQSLSIPRLELQAAVLGARLANSICEAHSIKIGRRFIWSDSRTVLYWIRSDHRKYRQFVAFRISELLETTEVKEWRWVPTKQNVADDATKWQKLPEINISSRWFNGPEFLQQNETNWPKNIIIDMPESENEIRTHFIHSTVLPPTSIDVNRFSNWRRLLRAQAFVCRFINNLKATTMHHMKTRNGTLTESECSNAENILYRQAQFEGYTEEVVTLLKNKELPMCQQKQVDKNSPIYRNTPYLDDAGVLRMRGRIDAAPNVPENMKRPILLPKKNQITNLVIVWFHKRFHHHNHDTVLNELRQIYDIPSLRQMLKGVRRNCQKCKNQNAKPVLPEMGDLPMARLGSFTRPFSYVGLDYFGPMTVAIGRRTEKRWGALFTCLTVRAVHLEIANTLSTDSCIMCIRRFMARRGIPIEIYSDNGTNFRGADNEMRKELEKVNFSEVQNRTTQSPIKWIFNPPSCPHMGGSWERLVRSVKTTLSEIRTSRNPSDELLHSMLMEVENIINTRPLTQVPIESATDEALTPNHFLLGSSNGQKPPGIFGIDDLILRKNWKKSQQMANMFWNRWVREYLPTITRRTKWFKKVKPIEEGDVVIVVDENSPRNSWPKGIVLQTIKGSNGQVRQAVVQIGGKFVTKPVAKLAVLDIKPKETQEINQPKDELSGGRMLNI